MEQRGILRPFATLFGSILVAGLIAGAAVAYPQEVRRAVETARDVVFGDGDPAPEPDRGASDLPKEHSPEDCQAVLDGVVADPPDGEDAKGLEHAIEVVRANCEKNPQARGLLNALEHLAANAAKHEAHERGRQGNGHGPDAEHGNAGEHANGHGNGHAG
jgi:hypothetical protein